MDEADEQCDVFVIGAGIAGLTAGALLASRGADVIVGEKHNVVGGCASFFQAKGYRFDVGATVAGGFGARGLHRRIFEHLGVPLEAQSIEPAMEVHIGDHDIIRWGDQRWNAERIKHFGKSTEKFWRAQESIADKAWRLAAKIPALPVDLPSLLQTTRLLSANDLSLLPLLGRTVGSFLPNNPLLRSFIDLQLLITAQTDSSQADLLYGMTALDLAREGVYHLPGGIFAIANQLFRALRLNHGRVRFLSTVRSIEISLSGNVHGVILEDGTRISANTVISAIPITDTYRLLPAQHNTKLLRDETPRPGWGAFMAYVGVPAGVVPEDLALHHQVLTHTTAPLGEGNSLFFSFSAQDEKGRTKSGGRAITISTHTNIRNWQRVWLSGQYESERERLGATLLAALDRLIPGASSKAEYISFATPHTFERYTGRALGHVGGQPQRPWTANLKANSYATGIKGLILCGDSVFPGQSTVGVSHSGIIAAQACLKTGEPILTR